MARCPILWLALDPPSESVSGDWRNQIMWKLGSEWLGNWDQEPPTTELKDGQPDAVILPAPTNNEPHEN
jgi:hypothetical protein